MADDRRIERQLAPRLHVELALGRALRRPRVPAAPFIAARFERQRFGQVELALVLEPVAEPHGLHVLAEPRGRLALERDRAEPVAVAARPAAVVPRADDEVIVVL